MATETKKTDPQQEAAAQPVDLSSSQVPAGAATNDPPLQAVELRGRFAIALCQAHRIGAEDGSSPCQEGLACTKKSDCLDLADKTLSYARDLSSGRLPTA